MGDMKALVMKNYREFVYEEIPAPKPGEDEVVVKIRACAICGSDVHGSGGGSGRRLPPIVMGHEASGEIAEVGANVQGWQVGDPVTFDSTEYCGHCWYCQNGLHNLCENRRILGVSCEDYKKDGAMAQYIAVKTHTLYRLPAEVSFEEASLVEPLAVGMHAVRISPLKSGDVAAVIGAGTIGLMTLLAAKSVGAEVYVAGRHEERRTVAKEMGACEVCRDDAALLHEMTAGVTCGRGADVVYDSVGTQSSFDMAMAAVRNGGTIVCIGNASKNIDFPLQECIVRQISVLGSYSSEGEYADCLEKIAEGKISLAAFTKNIVPLEDGAKAFERLISKEKGLLKVILTP